MSLGVYEKEEPACCRRKSRIRAATRTTGSAQPKGRKERSVRDMREGNGLARTVAARYLRQVALHRVLASCGPHAWPGPARCWLTVLRCCTGTGAQCAADSPARSSPAGARPLSSHSLPRSKGNRVEKELASDKNRVRVRVRVK